MPDNNQIVAASLQVDSASVKDASKSTLELKNNIKDLRAQYDAQKAGSAEQVEAYKKLKAAQDDLAKSTKNVADAAESGGVHFGDLREKIAGMGGPLGAASEGVGKLNLSFKALLSNPVVLVITAIVGALALLYKAFTNTFEGAEKVEQIFAGIKAAAQALFDNLGHIASAIAKFFTFDFSGAADEIKAVGNAVADAYDKMSELTKKAQELHKEQLTNDLDQAKRQKDLAVLRSQAQDEDVPVAKRKAALKELLALSEKNAKDDVDLAKRTTENKLAQLTLEKDGEKKNQDEINKLKVDQIHVETDAANEVRAIRKSLTQATKQELAELKEAQLKAAEEAKKRRQELVDFTNRLNKIQQDNDLATIKDTYEKEKKQIQIQIDDQKRQTQLDRQDKKITAAQALTLDAALEVQRQSKLDALRDKHNTELADKEAAFQKDLAAIRGKISVDGITDAREKERAQLQVTYQQQLADALKNYKDNADHLHQIQQALAQQFHADQQALDEKFRKEDADKRFKAEEARLKGIADNQKTAFDLRLKAVDDEQALVQKAFDDRLITEADYNTKVNDLAKARIDIRQQEEQAHEKVATAIGQTFGNLATLIGKQTTAGKFLAAAQAAIDTYASANKAYSAMAGIPIIGPALGIIAAAAAIAAGITNVKKILSVDTSGKAAPSASGSAASPSSPVSAPAAPVAPVQTSTTFTPQQNQTTTTATAVRAYVVEADMTSAQARNAQLERAARLGGN